MQEDRRSMFTFENGRCSINLTSLKFWLGLLLSLTAFVGLAISVSSRVTHDIFVDELAKSPFVNLKNKANGTDEAIPAVAVLIDRKMQLHVIEAQVEYNRDLSLINQNMALVEQRLDVMDKRIERIERMVETLLDHHG